MMLHINDLTYRIEGRVLFDQATAAISDGWKVGFVGRNGTGKSTMLKLIREEISPDDGSLSLRKGRRIGSVAQEAPATKDSLLDTVLIADAERTALLAEAETATDPIRIAEIQTRLADIDAHSAEARAAIILSGLGFDHNAHARPCSDFSGGWRMRVALAAVLFSAPDLLLLDEPTNYLDMEGALWLESYIRRYPYTALIVSHDRGLLNSAVTHILALDQGKLSVHNGNYDTYERRKAEQRAVAMAQATKQEAARRHMQAFVDRFKAKASKAKQAQSRVKMLEKMQEISIPIEERTIPFHFPDPKPPMAPPIIRVVEADLGYTEGQPVLRDVNLRIDQDDRIAILGANGQGKSTLVKAISGRLPALAGNIYKSKKLRIAYFAQHQIDELKPKQSPYDHVRALMPDGTEAEVRARTAQIGFGPDKADVLAEKLSGGEKARLLFGLITFEGPHLMILDEPTNHLDIDSREALMLALNEYQGAVILITHDAHLAEAVADRLWLIKDGKAARFEGDLSDYRDLILEANRTEKSEKKPADTRPVINKADQRKAAADMRKALSPLKKKCEELEKLMDRLQGDIAKLDEALAAPGLFETDIDKATQLSKDRARAVEALGQAEEDWLTASEIYENAKAEAEQALPG
ncbi:ABC-F family ATP-binding cassette domain-containing protein [Aquisalinus luteolus]|uniref:ABC transporter ATP-binding protein n=2 Tax=Aquisalinus luteolus TaxID=1566827 RepID=A0A8J3A2N6_9PROT|nr:ABC-F family ATP-binding cassette domain-containing protein [Aquisalinus luteolus]GGH95409.1 ABC transporter ATP-binding protein [Aquisalinus luteolus]